MTLGLRDPAFVGAIPASPALDWSTVNFYAYGHSYYAAASGYLVGDEVDTRIGFAAYTNRAVGGEDIHDTATRIVGNQNGPNHWLANTPGLVLVDSLLNTLALTDNTLLRTSAEEHLRACVAKLLTTTIIEDSTFTLTGTWTSTTSQAFQGGTRRITNTGGDYAEKTVAAGNYYLLVNTRDGATYTGGQFDVTLDGTPVGSIDMNALNFPAPQTTGFAVLPLPALAAGTLRVTANLLSRAGTVDCQLDSLYLVGAPVARVLLVKPLEVPKASHTKPSLLTYLQGLCDTIAAEFPGHVTVCDAIAGWNSATMIGADQLHPNATGIAYLADQIAATINAITAYP